MVYSEQIAGMPQKLFFKDSFAELVLVHTVYKVFSVHKIKCGGAA